MPGPGRGWALVRWDQEAMVWLPEAYWRVTVLPESQLSPRQILSTGG